MLQTREMKRMELEIEQLKEILRQREDAHKVTIGSVLHNDELSQKPDRVSIVSTKQQEAMQILHEIADFVGELRGQERLGSASQLDEYGLLAPFASVIHPSSNLTANISGCRDEFDDEGFGELSNRLRSLQGVVRDTLMHKQV